MTTNNQPHYNEPTLAVDLYWNDFYQRSQKVKSANDATLYFLQTRMVPLVCQWLTGKPILDAKFIPVAKLDHEQEIAYALGSTGLGDKNTILTDKYAERYDLHHVIWKYLVLLWKTPKYDQYGDAVYQDIAQAHLNILDEQNCRWIFDGKEHPRMIERFKQQATDALREIIQQWADTPLMQICRGTADMAWSLQGLVERMNHRLIVSNIQANVKLTVDAHAVMLDIHPAGHKTVVGCIYLYNTQSGYNRQLDQLDVMQNPHQDILISHNNLVLFPEYSPDYADLVTAVGNIFQGMLASAAPQQS